jgi:hypothetical protein
MISDDDLLLYYYRDGLNAAERARIGEALVKDPALAQRLQQLVNRLDAAANIPEVPVPAEALQRWKSALDQAARGQATRAAPPAKGTWSPWLAAAAAVVVALVAVLQLTRQPQLPDQTAQVTPPPAAEPKKSSAYERGLKSHLESTERQLASLNSATPEERAQLIDTIIEQNRLYALAAERAGEPQLARVLRAFSPVLEDLQKGSGDTSGSVAQLAFELRVMQGRLAAAPSSANQTTL